jgi:hypothetical protein
MMPRMLACIWICITYKEKQAHVKTAIPGTNVHDHRKLTLAALDFPKISPTVFLFMLPCSTQHYNAAYMIFNAGRRCIYEKIYMVLCVNCESFPPYI